MSSVKVEEASWVITVDSKRRLLRDATILIEDGVIRAVDKAERLRSEPADFVLDARGKVITPGFVNCHMHISYAHAVRGIFPDDLPQDTYLASVFRLQSSMTPDEEYYTSLLAITELLKNGCTCILDPGTITSLDSGVKAIGESGIRAVVGKEVVDMPNPLNLHVMSTEQAARTIEDVIRLYDEKLNGRLRAWAMPFSPDYCSDDLLLASKEVADRRGVGLTVHTAPNEEAVKRFQKQRGLRPVEYMAKKEMLGRNVLLSHMLAVDAGEVELLARGGTKVVHCPSVAVRGSGATKIGLFPEMLDKGVCVSLGSDSANSSYYLDMLRLMYLAAVLYKDARQSRKMIPCETALEMGTVRGAEALSLGHVIGSLEVGKRADLVVFNTKRPEWRSLFYPVNNLIYSCDGRSVETVLVDGKTVVENQRAVYVDEERLLDRVQRVGEDILQRTGVSFKHRWNVE